MKTQTMRLAAAMTAAVLTAGMSMSVSAKTRPTKIGDVNLDSHVNVSDAVLMCRLIAGDITAAVSAQGQVNADINQDGFLNTTDSTYLLRYLAHLVSDLSIFLPPEETTETTTATTTAATTTATTTTTTVTTTATTASETTETTVIITTTSEPVTDAEYLEVDGYQYALGVPFSMLAGSPADEFSMQYDGWTADFAVYTPEDKPPVIAFADAGSVIGYYVIGENAQAPEGYKITQYVDRHSAGSGKTYAVLAMKSGRSIDGYYIADKTDLTGMNKLNFYAVNGVRALNGLYALKWNDNAASAAYQHSKDMADNNYFDHYSQDGRDPGTRLEDAGCDWMAYGENIDAGYHDPFSALDGWYNSESGHRNNLLRDTFTYLGVGFAYNANADYGFYGTQDFYRGWDD